MQDIVDFIIGLIVEFFRMLISVIIIQFVLFNLGRIFFLLVTLGKYPRGKKVEEHSAWIVTTGFLLIVVAWSSLAIYNNFFLVEAAT